MSAGRRVHERFDHELAVKVEVEDRVIECATHNMSLGGMYLLMEEKLPYGQTVTLEFHLPALRGDVQIEATVRWHKDRGVGVQFGSLRAREVWALNQLFKDKPELRQDH